MNLREKTPRECILSILGQGNSIANLPIYQIQGNWMPTPTEREHQRSEEAQERAQQERQRAEQLAARLRELGIELTELNRT